MLDRQKLEAILTRRFAGASAHQVAAAANAIMGLAAGSQEIAGDPQRDVSGPSPTDGDGQAAPRE